MHSKNIIRLASSIFFPLILFFFTLFISSCSNDAKRSKYLAVNNDVVEKFSNQGLVLSKLNDFTLLDATSITEPEIEELSHIAHDLRRCGGFTQIEEGDLEKVLNALKKQREKATEYSLSKNSLDSVKLEFKEDLAALLNLLKTEPLKEHILFLQDQGTRSAFTNNPNLPINNFYNEIEKMLEDSNLDYSLEKVAHRRTNQNSIRVRITGSKNPENVVILGGHVDSLSRSPRGEAPGADDNASGSAAIFEVLKVLSRSNFSPSNTIEFIWYAAEERGLVGSNEIARDYQSFNKKVIGVMQLDMILYPGNGDVIGLITDYVDTELTLYTEKLVELYLNTPVLKFRCGYACSDHASWHQNGYPAVSPTEAKNYNRNIHTSRDVFDERSDINHALKFTKLALAFIFEKGNFVRNK